MSLDAALGAFLPRQRWYSGKGRAVDTIDVEHLVPLRTREPLLFDAVVAVTYADGDIERFQVPIGLRTERQPDGFLRGFDFAAIGDLELDGRHGFAYDALYDDALTTLWLRGILAEEAAGDVRFHRRGQWDVTAEDLPCRRLDAEQSNSSLVYGDRYILKLYRKLGEGENPDLEVTRALAERGATYIAEPLGWVEGWNTTLAMLAPYYRSATDGWTLAATSVRDAYADLAQPMEMLGGDFSPESHRLGHTTAAMHRDLAAALDSDEAGPKHHAETAAMLRDRLAYAVQTVAELARYRERIEAAYDAVAQLTEPVLVQRVHGDYHLGQVLRVDAGWVVLDFEGEPARPLEERLALMTPLRDVAGMLRSFDYAARHLLADRPRTPELVKRGEQWVIRNRNAFCDGYAEEYGSDPRDQSVVLRAVELDKAVYEVLYEARHRPDWMFIPLQSIARMLG